MKKILLPVVVFTLAATANAASFNLTHEVKLNDESMYKGTEKIEYTLVKGEYKLDNGMKFKFDVDRDFIDDAGKGIENHEGWDTMFGIYVPVGKFDMFGKSWENEIGAKVLYDQEDAYNTTGEYEETEYGLELITSTNLSDVSKFSIGLVGVHADTDETNSTNYGGEYCGIETTISTKWTKKWSSRTTFNQYWGGYTDSKYVGDSKETADYDSEAYTWELDHETRWTQNIIVLDDMAIYLGASFNAKLINQGSEHKEQNNNKEILWAQPQIGLKYVVNDVVSVHGLFGYNVWALENSNGAVQSEPKEFEAALGFKVNI